MQEALALADYQHKTSTSNFTFLTEKLSSVCVERATLVTVWDEMAVMVMQLKDDVRKSVINFSTQVQMTYQDIVCPVKL